MPICCSILMSVVTEPRIENMLIIFEVRMSNRSYTNEVALFYIVNQEHQSLIFQRHRVPKNVAENCGDEIPFHKNIEETYTSYMFYAKYLPTNSAHF